MNRRFRFGLAVLSLLALAGAGLYLGAFVNPKFWAFTLSLRLPRLGGMVLAAFAVSAASLVFQTLIRNTIVTPCLLGMNSLYVLIHTTVVFAAGTGSAFATSPFGTFVLDIGLMGAVAGLVYYKLFKATKGNVLYILLIGTVLATFFSSIQGTLIRLMDPNDYNALLSSLVASFTQVNAAVMVPGGLLLALVAVWLRNDLAVLDVLAFGRETAVNLGIEYEAVIRRLMVGVALYVAVATAVVGPLSFLGLITANISRQIFKTYRHSVLIAGSVWVGIVILIAGEFFVEHAVTYSVPVSVFVTIGGGLYFLYLILKEGRA